MVYYNNGKGIRVTKTYDNPNYEFVERIDNVYHVSIPCTLYIEPAMKKTYCTRTGRDLLRDVLKVIVQDLPEARDPRITRGTIRFIFIGPPGVRHRDPQLRDAERDFSRKMTEVLRTCGAAWHEMCKPIGGLQGVVHGLLKDPDYKFKAFVHFASRYGAEEAFRVQGLMDSWA